MAYVKSLPINDPCNVFMLHENANITYAQNETFLMLEALLQLQPQSSTGGGVSREEVIDELASSILEQVPPPIDTEMVEKKYPVMYEQSMNTVIIQEIIRLVLDYG